MLLVPWPAMETITQNLGDMSGKVMIDVSWPPVKFTEDGYYVVTIDTSSAEMIQGWNPGAMVVKAFGTLGSNVIDDPLMAGGPVTVPIASDYAIAKEKTAAIAIALGLDPVDAGPLHMARNIEAMMLLYYIPVVQVVGMVSDSANLDSLNANTAGNCSIPYQFDMAYRCWVSLIAILVATVMKGESSSTYTSSIG